MTLVGLISVITGLIGNVLLVPFVVIGIIFILKGYIEKDEEKKRRDKKIGVWFILIPLLLLMMTFVTSIIFGYYSQG